MYSVHTKQNDYTKKSRSNSDLSWTLIYWVNKIRCSAI